MNDALLTRRANIVDQQKAVDKSVVAKIAKAEDADAVIKSALTNPAELKTLVAQASRSPEGTQSLSRAIADAVSQEKNPRQFLMENERTLKPLLNKLGPNHYENLQTLTKAEEKSEQAAAKLRAAFERENALANELRSQRALIWIAGGVAVLCAAGWVYVKFFLGGIPAALAMAKRDIEREHPEVAKTIAPFYARYLDKRHQQAILKST